MSITFTSGGNLGETDVSPNIKGVLKGSGNSPFANFSDVLTTATDENHDLSLDNSVTNDKRPDSLGDSQPLNKKFIAEGVGVLPLANNKVDSPATPISCDLSRNFLDGPVVSGKLQSLVEPIVDGAEYSTPAQVINSADEFLSTLAINDSDNLLTKPVVNDAASSLGMPIINSAEDFSLRPVIKDIAELFPEPIVSNSKDLTDQPVVNPVAGLFATPAFDDAEGFPVGPVINESEGFLVAPVVNGAEDFLVAPAVKNAGEFLAPTIVNDANNLLAETDAISTDHIPVLPVVNLAAQVVTLPDSPSSGARIDDAINKLGINGSVSSDVHYNTTTAFMDSRIVASDFIEVSDFNGGIDKNELGINFSTLEDLNVALNVFEKPALVGASKGELVGKNISEIPALDFLSDLTNGISVHLNFKNSNSSSVFFDIRDLKKNLNEALPQAMSDNGRLKTPVEFLIPQTVPLELGTSGVLDTDHIPFIPVKVQLLDVDGKLGVTDLFDFAGDDNVEPGVNLISVTKAIELDPDVDTRSKILIGFSIPKDTDPNRLPDFVKLDVSLSNGNRSDTQAEKPFITKIHEPGRVEIIQKNEVPFDLKDKTKALILALGEMSNLSKNGEKIIINTVSADPILKFSQNVDARPVPLMEANALFHKQIFETNNSDLFKENPIGVNTLGEKPLTLDLLQKQFIIEKNKVLFSTTKIDGRAGSVNGALNLAVPNKFFSSVKNHKTSFFADQTGTDAVEKKLDGSMFNPKSFLEAADALRMKQITLPTPPPQAEQLMGRQPDIAGFAINKFDNTISPNSGTSINSHGPAAGVNNSISLYSAQYASRLGMLVVDKVLKGQQNFEINLEPESFGKIKVNITLDKQAIDIRMVAETQAAASLLRANEDSLLQITSQNGMKLANFAVGMQSGSDQQRQNSNQNRNRVTDKANSMLKNDTTRNNQSQTSYRTPTSLNLIA